MAALWVVAFIVLLVGSQFVRWSLNVLATVSEFDLSGLPLPILILAGTALAIAANSRKQWGVSLDHLLDETPDAIAKPTATANVPTPPKVEPATSAVMTTTKRSANPAIAVSVSSTQATIPTPTQTQAASVSYQIDPTHHRDERRPS